MSTEETPEFIETKIGVSRHQRLHIALVSPDEMMVYLSHPEECEARLNSRSLTECRYSYAMDMGIQPELWTHAMNSPQFVIINYKGTLSPVEPVARRRDSWDYTNQRRST